MTVHSQKPRLGDLLEDKTRNEGNLDNATEVRAGKGNPQIVYELLGSILKLQVTDCRQHTCLDYEQVTAQAQARLWEHSAESSKQK